MKRALVIAASAILALMASYGLAMAGEPQSVWFWSMLGAI